jgi:pimeloyl-ACP methyl ester carboxylesterase
MESFDHQRGRSLSVDGAELYYEVLGAQANTPLVLLHGGLGNLEEFNPIVPHLLDSYRLIAIDSRGHGKSTLGSSALSYARLQSDVEKITTELGLDRFSVIGFSDGGIVGLRLAASAQSRVAKLVAIGTPHELREDDPLRPILSAVSPESWQAKFPETVESYQRLNPAPDFTRLVHASKVMWLDSSNAGYPAKAVENIRCELLVARGDDDHLVSRGSAVTLANLVPNAKLLIVPYAGHVLHADRPQLFSACVHQFLQRRA